MPPPATPPPAVPASVVARRLRAQLLAAPPLRSVEAVVGHLLAVQGQDPRGLRLAIRPRSAGLRAADVDHALTVERSVVVTWVNRGTLHLIRSEDLPWLHALTTPRLATMNARRLAQEGVSPSAAERGIATIASALSAHGPLRRDELRGHLDVADIPTAGQALVHLLLAATLRGLIVRGPMTDGEQAFVLRRDWLREPPAFDHDVALGELASRFLVGHGPATDRDLARWAGIGLGQARAGLSRIASQLVEEPGGLVDLANRADDDQPLPPRLLGSFDPLLCGWTSREPIISAGSPIVTSNGIFRPFALVDGRAVATWRLTGGTVALDPARPLSKKVRAALLADAIDVRDYLGLS